MKKIISFKVATKVNIFTFSLVSLFHLFIIGGILLFDYAPVDYLWGGQMQSSNELLKFEILSIFISLLCLLVVLIRSQKINIPALVKSSKVVLWLLFLLFLLNTLGNVLAKTTFEKCLCLGYDHTFHLLLKNGG